MFDLFTAISLGLGEKFAQVILSCGALIGGMAIALYIGPVFACICGAYTPIFMFMMMALGIVSKKAMDAKF